MCEHNTNECTTIKTLVKQAKLKETKQSKKGRTISKHMVNILAEKKMKRHLGREMVRTEDLHLFENINVLNSDRESLIINSSGEGEIRKRGSAKNFKIN